MATDFSEVESQVRRLPAEERARLAEILLESLTEISEPAIKATWDAEIRARVEAYERGGLDLVPAEETFARARKLAE